MDSRPGGIVVPRPVLVVLALGCLLAAFLLGRDCSRGQPRSQAPAPPATVADVAATPAAARSEEPAFVAPVTVPTPLAALPPATSPRLLPETSATPSVAHQDPEIARYFEEADGIQARAKYWSDPQALAKTILEQTASGNPGGFDELVRAQQSARAEMAHMSVPAACAEHHRRSLAVMDAGIGLLERVRNALSSGDLGGLDGLQDQARALEREAREIDELGQKIRQR